MNRCILFVLVAFLISECSDVRKGAYDAFSDNKQVQAQIGIIQKYNRVSFQALADGTHDSSLIVKLDVDEGIPADSLSDFRAKAIAIVVKNGLINADAFTHLTIVFSQSKKSLISNSGREMEYNYTFERH